MYRVDVLDGRKLDEGNAYETCAHASGPACAAGSEGAPHTAQPVGVAFEVILVYVFWRLPGIKCAPELCNQCAIK
ncbi:unnamed protein product [Arctia plantaginis]|uniref:Uncharacterized protein n=1 Tax=Arctia plantaginis TaxID=874455 RepID=A0A8S1ATT3_ARCPL|nr:unnamed protein product [Arctia plantaginis]